MGRWRLAWACLRGRPVAYRLTIRGGLDFPGHQRGAIVQECLFDGRGHDGSAINVGTGGGA